MIQITEFQGVDKCAVYGSYFTIADTRIPVAGYNFFVLHGPIVGCLTGKFRLSPTSKEIMQLFDSGSFRADLAVLTFTRNEINGGGVRGCIEDEPHIRNRISGECVVKNFKYTVGDDIASYTCDVENPIEDA